MFYDPPRIPHCPECEKRHLREYEKYGFNIIVGGKYWTIIKEVKACCPIKVNVVNAAGNTVTVEYNGKQYTKGREDFLKSSWRDYDAY